MSYPTRLLDTETGEFVVFTNPATQPPYAILSHTWNLGGEQSYAELREIQASDRRPLGCDHCRASTTHEELPLDAETRSCLDHPRISEKVRRACLLARDHGYRYIWIDSCCIDKTSSAELSEAINSMFAWYQLAAVCFAFLEDVPGDQDPRALDSDFRRSRWFTRGWTLQELIAPRIVIFLSRDWEVIGTKGTLTNVIESVTSISATVLKDARAIRHASVARRMSWASKRVTTRVEDEAYSLLGIFELNMPTLYGEGKRAFHRLQEEILKRIPDQSLFAWGPRMSSGILPEWSPSSATYCLPSSLPTYFFLTHVGQIKLSFLATSPADFSTSYDVLPISHKALVFRIGTDLSMGTGSFRPEYTTSSYGIRVQLPTVSCEHLHTDILGHHGSVACTLALLACELLDGSLLGVVCYTYEKLKHSVGTALKSAILFPYNSARSSGRLVVIPRRGCSRIIAALGGALLEDVYIDTGYFQQSTQSTQAMGTLPRMLLSPRSREALRRSGCTIVPFSDPSWSYPDSDPVLLISTRRQEHIRIIFRLEVLPRSVLDRYLATERETDEPCQFDMASLWGVPLTTIDVGRCGSADPLATGHARVILASGIEGTCTVSLSHDRDANLYMLDILFE